MVKAPLLFLVQASSAQLSCCCSSPPASDARGRGSAKTLLHPHIRTPAAASEALEESSAELTWGLELQLGILLWTTRTLL